MIITGKLKRKAITVPMQGDPNATQVLSTGDDSTEDDTPPPAASQAPSADPQTLPS